MGCCRVRGYPPKPLELPRKVRGGVDPVRWTVSGLILKPSEVSRQHAVGHARAH